MYKSTRSPRTRSERGTRFVVSGFPGQGVRTIDGMEPTAETTLSDSPKPTHTAALLSRVFGAVGRLLTEIRREASATGPGVREPKEGREP